MNDANDWNLESLRVTTFHREIFDLKSADFFQIVLGVEPEVSQRQATNRQDTQPFGVGQLVCSISANRVDWIYTAPIPLGGEDGGIGLVKDGLAKFLPVVGKWIEGAPPILRVAFGGVAFKPVTSKSEGYKALQNYLPDLRLDPEGSSDLSYRINRPRRVSVAGVEVLVNRLSTWCVRRIEIFPQMHSGDSRMPAGKIERATCELDLSTDANRMDLLDQKAAAQALESLIDVGAEILARGDIA